LTSGKVFFKGKDITGKAPHKIADMGVTRTFQIMRPTTACPPTKTWSSRCFHPRPNGPEAGGAAASWADRNTVAVDILEEIGFERDSYVPYKMAATLPTGYLKRLELARCLALKPEIIFCDEVFSGLSMSEIASMVPAHRTTADGRHHLIMIEHRLRELFRWPTASW
jgi:branched-chain amino acid transport system ATP-binding protein